MRKKVVYEEHPFGKNVKVGPIITDFLPSPEEIAAAIKMKKVTLFLGDDSLDFFKKQAKKHNISYQAMIRNLLQQYAVRAARAGKRDK